ncbi:hypothetical protein T03_14878 [Trichinella britovi]|uniref:Uncharacterized protein n=1 Tax=Trichinella britovi TaxID=45882 RepID=A0A0V1D036_TRIBR|nr:hypothetical protein T03_14878 [Trichinella britovi]
MLTVVKNIRFALNFFSNFQDRNKQNSFINQKTLAEICHKEKGQSDMTKVNGKASEVGLLGRNFDIIQGMLNFLTDLKQAAAPRSYCDVEKNNATDHVDRYTEISNELQIL